MPIYHGIFRVAVNTGRSHVVTPQRLIVHIGFGDDGCGQLVLEDARAYLDNCAVVVSRARCERLSRHRLLDPVHAIPYRREETAYPAGWLFDRLTDHFVAGQVFKDVDSIQLGDDFVEVINRAVGSCDVLLAMIGNEWVTITDEHGRRRLDDPDDFVRLEIEAALTRNVRVIPILVDGARMPRADELPDSLVRLVRRQALELDPARFDFDTGRLLKVLDGTLREVRAPTEDAASMPAPTGPASDPSATELPEASRQLERAERSATSSIPSATTARPAGYSPSASDRPPGKPRRGPFTRARVLAGAGVGGVLILLTVIIVANSGRRHGGTTPTASPSPTSDSRTTSIPTNQGVRRAIMIMQDNFSTKSYGWDEVDDPERRIAYRAGAYELLARTTAQLIAFPHREGRPTTGDVLLQVDARLQTGKAGNGYGLVCKSSDLNNLYRFNITNDGYYIIIKVYRGVGYSLQGPAPAPSHVISPTLPNHIQALCASHPDPPSTELRLWVNGHEVKAVLDSSPPLPTGTRVGIYARDVSGGGTTWTFDNFRVWQLE